MASIKYIYVKKGEFMFLVLVQKCIVKQYPLYCYFTVFYIGNY